MASVSINGDRLWSSLMTMAEIGKTPGGGVRRLALSDEDRAARDRLAEWLGAAGLTVRIDDLGNMYGRRGGAESGAAPVVFGSHLDTVPTGGRFDGVLGVMGALEVIRALDDAGIRTRAPLEMVNWTNEEGARFAPAMLASGVVSGRFTREEAYAARDAGGRSFGGELARIGYQGEAANRLRECAAYLELHVEQGPVLERAGRQVGVLEGIEGISWSRLEVTGRAAHAGPTPTADRRDALVAAAKLVLLARDAAEHLEGVRTTIGRVEVSPNTVNVIPGRVEMTLDVRSRRDAGLDETLRAADESCRAVEESDRVEARRTEFWRSPVTPFSPTVIAAVAGAAKGRGFSAARLWAGAGHDAKYMADRFPTGMIFVPSKDGLSHNEAEWTPPEDCARGAAVLLDAVLALAGTAGA
ncbi:MAG TPA: Zn-dependent hydrolase [bacterium]|nr:Zn-dependent hydrolase [bacterium]